MSTVHLHFGLLSSDLRPLFVHVMQGHAAGSTFQQHRCRRVTSDTEKTADPDATTRLHHSEEESSSVLGACEAMHYIYGIQGHSSP
jgi:hypothetical protein